jgi:hypothetical protein
MYSLNLSVSYDFAKFNGSRKIKGDVPFNTTQGWACPFTYIYILSSSKKLVVLHHFFVRIYGPKNVVIAYQNY